MKKLMAFILIALFAIVSAVPVFAGPETSDSLLVARQVLLKPAQFYVVQFQYAVEEPGNDDRVWHEVHGLYRKNVGLTFLQINGVVITNVTEKSPLTVLPRPQGSVEVRYLWGYAEGIDRHGETVQTGHAYDDRLNLGEPIVFDLRLAKIQKFIGYDANFGNIDQPILRLYDQNGNWSEFWYNASVGGFYVWIDPGQSSHRYEIIGAGGVVIASGDLPHDANSIQNVNSSLNFKLQADVLEVFLEDDNSRVRFHGLNLDSTVAVGDQYVPGAVFAVEKQHDSKLYVSTYGIINLGVVVYGVSANGDLTELWIRTFGSSNEDSRHVEVSAEGYEKVIFVIDGGYLPFGQFEIYFTSSGKG